MNAMSGKRKAVIVAAVFAAAIIAVLGVLLFVARRNLATYRLAAHYSASEALEETVTAAEGMSAALTRAVYATDSGMRARLCAEVYASALAAESAMSTLPFATHELERIAGYFNESADYARALCAGSGEADFTDAERETLRELDKLASALTESLRALQTEYHNGAVEMDSREIRPMNIGLDGESARVSAELLRVEDEFPRRASLKYDGRYGARSVAAASVGAKKLSDAEKLAVVAAFAGVSPAEVRLAYAYDGADGVKCYAAGDALVTVGESGVLTLGRERLVEQEKLTRAEAQRAAHEFLQKRGYAGLTLESYEAYGGMARMRFADEREGAVYIDDAIVVAVALDDGAVCAFDATAYTTETAESAWSVGESEAAALAPAGLDAGDVRRVVIRSEGGRAIPCYEVSCTDGEKKVIIHLNADSGRQERITVSPV